MKMIIGGKHVDASDKKTIDVINPTNMQVMDTVPAASKEDVDLAFENARKGFIEWKSVPLYKRIEILNKFSNILEERLETLCQLECRQSGKAISLCRAETKEAIVIFRGYCEMARNFCGEVLPFNNEPRIENDLIITVREPLGIIGCIIPFNYPTELYAHKVAPALVVGNVCIIKPASDAPLGNILMTEWLLEAGVPANAVQVLTGSGAKVGKWMVENKYLSLINLTGSTEVGIETMATASKHLHHCHLELGGNDPFILFEDCDLDKAVEESIGGRCSNAGQTCCANKRFIVQNSIKDKYIEKMIAALKKVPVGDPAKDETVVGPLVSERAAKEVEEQVKFCVSQGAKIAYGGKRFDHTFFEPTLLVDVTKDMDVAKDLEIFGPVIPVIGFDTVEEAVAIANNTSFGLSGGLMTNNIKKAIQVAMQMQCGCVVMNGNGNYRSAFQPFGGYKMTGMGREGITYTLEEMTQKKAIALKAVLS